MSTYTITLTEAENYAFGYAALSPDEWIQNAVHERCRIAIEDILKTALEKSIETNTPLPTTRDEIVLMSFEKGWVKSAVERYQENLNNTRPE
jgi:hypothetical protein